MAHWGGEFHCKAMYPQLTAWAKCRCHAASQNIELSMAMRPGHSQLAGRVETETWLCRLRLTWAPNLHLGSSPEWAARLMASRDLVLHTAYQAWAALRLCRSYLPCGVPCVAELKRWDFAGRPTETAGVQALPGNSLCAMERADNVRHHVWTCS